MTPDRNDHTPDDDTEHGVLSDAGTLGTAGLGILGAPTEQVSVELPAPEADEDADDDVIDDEVDLGAIEAESTIEEADAVSGDDEAVTLATADVEIVEDEDHADVAADAPVHDDIVVELADGEADEEADTAEDDSAESAAEASARIDAFDALVRGGIAETDAAAESAAKAADAPAPVSASVPPLRPLDASAEPAAEATEPRTVTGTTPTTRREAHHTVEPERAVERVQPRTDVTLTSKRLGEFEADRETSDLLTPDRLLDPHQIVRPEPEGLWQHLVYSISGHRINLGDGKRARVRKELDRRIAVPLAGGARFVPVLSRKGGVGKTTVTTLLGMALADARDDRIIAIDANPDRGTLAERISKVSGKTIRDLVRMRSEVTGYNDLSAIVARDETRLDVLASDADPRVSEALNDRDYHDVASLAAHYYSIVLTDTGTGIVHSVMGATLDVADELIIVTGLSVDEARLASETLTWLETNGFAEQVRNAVVVLNNARPGVPLVREGELEAHFRTRVRAVIRMPYDPLIAAGSTITFRDLKPATRLAARELAAAVVEGLRTLARAA